MCFLAEELCKFLWSFSLRIIMVNMKMYRAMGMALLLFVLSSQVFAQRGELVKLPLTDLSAFRPQAGNWQIVGDVTIHPTLDIHHAEQTKTLEEQQGKKKKKKKKKQQKEQQQPTLKAVTFTSGTGILLNMNDDQQKDHLVTDWEHGDILLELDVMMPKGSNSGIYLQGRYEVQLLDSWGKKYPKYGDIGGIYRNWETEKGKVYMGKAPSTNAAKAPGLWQHMKIAFQAPRFNEAGEKTANAKFVYVELNGVRIHENYEVPLPTGGPIEKNEVAKGPLMIQGDHGPVAFRNMQYRLLNEREVTLQNISYQVFEGPFDGIDATAEVAEEGTLDVLTCEMIDPDNPSLVRYKGEMVVATAGTYQFRLNAYGQAKMTVAGKTIDTGYGYLGTAFEVPLQAGSNAFELRYFKNTNWWDAMLGLFSTDSYPKPLHAFGSYPSTKQGAPPIYVKTGNEPKMLRAFLDFEGDRSKRLTHTLAVGSPAQCHYIYDLKTGSPVCMWRGNFLDATPMWHSRGDGSYKPRGAAQYLFVGHSVATLATESTAFPDQLNEVDGFHNLGYQVGESDGFPYFLYKIGDLAYTDRLATDPTGNYWTRTVEITEGINPGNLYVKMAEGEEVRKMPDGSYAIDRNFYVRPQQGTTVKVRTVGGKQELIALVNGQVLEYGLVW